MNRAYKLVWNSISGSWVVASELAKGRKKSSSTALKLAVLLAAGLTAGMASAAPAANALPSGESVASGTASFDRSVANQLSVNQTSSKLITNWSSFDIGSSAKVVFNQPDAASAALNRITSGSASQIFGQLSGNGQLVIVNPNGITFGAGSQVSAAGIIASVLDVNDNSFTGFAPIYNRGAATGSIDNQGSLTATAGAVYLFGPSIKNSGSISASGGDVSLVNADTVNIMPGLGVLAGSSTITGLIQTSGNISATQVSGSGGRIQLTGDTAQNTSQIQLAGTLDATTDVYATGYSILINGDVNLNAANTALSFNLVTGYSLSNRAALNLNGASNTFNLNGNAYTVIRDVNQLQAMGSNLSGRYVLAGNIDASDTINWNSGAGFVPVGDSTNSFTGVLDGLGHIVNQLAIQRQTTDNVGLIGYATNGTMRNIGLKDHVISGKSFVGALVGQNTASNGGVASISNSYADGTVSAGGTNIGGLVGLNSADNATLSISGSYAAGSVAGTVSGGSGYGGLVGQNLAANNGSASISNSYATVRVTGNINNAGGLVGYNFSSSGGSASISNSYATGSVTVTVANSVGGLVGFNFGYGGTASVANSYATGAVAANAGGLVGVHYAFNTAGSVATVSNSFWDTQTSGQSVGVKGNYSGTLLNVNGLTTSAMHSLSSFSSWGTDIDAQAGSGSVWRIYEGQTAPLLRSFLKPLNISANNVTKTYDATSYSASTAGYSANAAYDSSKLLGTAMMGGSALNARNAGTYSIDIGGLYSAQDGYDLGVSSGTLTINKRQLTITASADSKEYDGKLTSSATAKPTVVGRQRGDSIVGLTQSYASKNAGTGKTINVDAGYTIRDGNGGNNYDVVLVNSTAGVITPKVLTISTVANSKVYDGGVTSANKPVVTGLLSGDRVTGLFQQYDSKTVGTGKKLLIKAGYVVNDGNGGGNYTVTEQGSMDGVITAN